MTARMILALSMLIGIGATPVVAATAQQDLSITAVQDVRSPVYGDPGARAVNPHWTAQQWARADRQTPGTENGNQPDRAGAGGGSR